MAFKNLIDDTSTTVSTSTPGVQLDLRYRTTLSRATLGVPVRFWVNASSTVANDTGAVQILDSTGAVKLSVPITGTTEQRYVVDGYLPATDAKYDAHYGGNTLGTLSVYWFSLLEYADISPLEGALAATISPFTLSAAGVVDDRLAGWTITKTGGSDSTFDAGTSSTQSFTGDGFVEFIVPAAGANSRCIALSESDPNVNYTSMGWMLAFEPTTVGIWRSGVNVSGIGSFTPGEVWRIRRTGSTISVEQAGAAVYTFAATTSAALYVDVSLYASSSSFSGVRLYDYGVPTAITWTNVTNVTNGYVTEGSLAATISPFTLSATGAVV